MAITSQKLLPPSRSAGGKLVKADSLSIVAKKLINIDKLFKKNLITQKKKITENKKYVENRKREDAEVSIERKKESDKLRIKAPGLPKTGFLDAIQNFISYTFLGYLIGNYYQYFPKLLEFSKNIVPVVKTVEKIVVGTFEATVALIDFGYKANDEIKKFVNFVGGKDAEKTFDEFTTNFKNLINRVMTLGLYNPTPVPAKSNGGLIRKMATGGNVPTRGGRIVGGAVTRKIKVVKPKRITPVRPQQTMPGKDVGGKERIKRLFPDPSEGPNADPKAISPLRSLKTTSKTVKQISPIAGIPFGAIMGAGIDMAMGQRPDKRIFSAFGNSISAIVQNSIDYQTNNALGDVTKTISAMSGGGSVPSGRGGRRTTGEEVGMQIAKMFEVGFNSKINQIFNDLIREMGGMVPGGAAGGVPMGGVPAAEISENQKQAADDLIRYFEKLYGKNAAIGIVANLLRESGLRTTTPDNSSFEGMAQWSRNDRWPKFVAWAQSKGKNPYSRSAQAEWIAIELKQLGTDARLRKASSPEEAASLFYNEFERAAYSKPILGNRYTPDNPHERKNAGFIASLTGGRAAPGSMVTGGIAPSNIPLTSGQGWRWGRMHKGIDLDGGDGSPISSAQDATVIWAGDKGDNYGNTVVLRYSNGAETRFAHLKSFNVRNGQKIKAGQLIGRQGSTGRSTGSHLHFEYYPNGGAMTYRGYGNAASVMNSYFRYGGNVKPKVLKKPDTGDPNKKKTTPAAILPNRIPREKGTEEYLRKKGFVSSAPTRPRSTELIATNASYDSNQEVVFVLKEKITYVPVNNSSSYNFA